jgi:hypothetical protein
MLRLVGQLKSVNLAASPRWAGLMQRNSVDPSALALPVFVQQGGKDVIVAPAVTNAFVGRLCRRNPNVRYLVSPAGDHVSAGKTAAPDAVTWIGDRSPGGRLPATVESYNPIVLKKAGLQWCRQSDSLAAR